MTVSEKAIAAAWATWHSRHGGKLGPGPAFREAIEAAIAVDAEAANNDVMPTIEDCHKMAAQVGMRFVPYTLSEPAPASAAEPVKVKPLEWGNTSYATPEAFSIVGAYRIVAGWSGGWSASIGKSVLACPDGRTNHATVDDAKAAAQADFERRVRSAIVATTPEERA